MVYGEKIKGASAVFRWCGGVEGTRSIFAGPKVGTIPSGGAT